MPKSAIHAYQPVIGLEIHIQLLTRSKVFATEAFTFGGQPNEFISPITIAHPGALPGINEACVQHAIRLGLATHCEISRETYFARKNYFYPDLPKGYQISQDQTPVCREGHLDLIMPDRQERHIRIERIHIEEDAGKSIHDQDPRDTLIDLNRAGVGLAELVTHPDLRTAEEAGVFLAEIRRLVRYLGICDGNMEEGSLRCDANVSVMRKGATEFGTRAEVKNLNSISNLTKAITYEIERQVNVLESGGRVRRETRTWDAAKGKTSSMRHKETADDYRYFPEPDLLPLLIRQEELEAMQQTLPPLPLDLFRQYYLELDIPYNEALALVEDPALARYFDQVRQLAGDPRAAGNWILGPVKAYLNQTGTRAEDFALPPDRLAEVIRLIAEGRVSHTAAKDHLFPALLEHPQRSAQELAEAHNLILRSNKQEIEAVVEELLTRHQEEVLRFRKGKKGLMGFFVGQTMKAFKGKVDPKEVNAILAKKLNG